jgi:hypothetical protein
MNDFTLAAVFSLYMLTVKYFEAVFFFLDEGRAIKYISYFFTTSRTGNT